MDALSWSLLPSSVLVHILQLVPLQDRLASCSLVSSSWAAAAAAATDSITVGLEYTRRLRADSIRSFVQYTQQHGHFLTSLTLATTADCELRQLPCPNLRQLALWYSRVQLGPLDSSSSGGSSSAGLGAAAAAGGLLSTAQRLTRLELLACEVLGGPHQLTVLASLPDLRHLGLSLRGRPNMHQQQQQWEEEDESDSAAGPADASSWGRSLPAPGDLFAQTTQLTHLDLYAPDAGTFRHFGYLGPRLQDLVLRELDSDAAAGLDGALPSLGQLTRLALTQADFPLTLSTLPAMTALTGLSTLQLTLCRQGVHPDVLAPLTQLREVDICYTELLGGAPGTAVLLAWLLRLQHLTHLAIGGPQWGVRQQTVQAAVSRQAYAALTASTGLAHLDLTHWEVPVAAWHHIFAAGRQLPSLRTFRRQQHPDAPTSTRLQSEHISIMAHCCYNLQTLQLPGAVQQGASIQPLLRLPCLQELAIDSSVIRGDEALAVLLQLTALTVLQLSGESSPPRSSLQQLTALRSLHALDIQFASWELRNQAPAGHPPDVWMQLAHTPDDVWASKCDSLAPDFVNLGLV